jgi:hypothetical protein
MLSILVLVLLTVVSLGPNWDGAPVKVIWNKLVDKLNIK